MILFFREEYSDVHSTNQYTVYTIHLAMLMKIFRHLVEKIRQLLNETQQLKLSLNAEMKCCLNILAPGPAYFNIRI